MSDIPDRPKVREDLVFVRREKKGEVSHIIKDPVTGRYFEVEEEEAAVLRFLDGTRTVDEVLASFENDSEIDLEEIKGFILALNEKFFLESNRPSPKRGRFFEEFSIFHIRVRVINPGLIVNFLARHLGFLVSTPFLVLSAFIIVLALVLTAGHYSVLTRGVGDLKNPASIVLFYVIASVIMTIHEFAHAVACRRFGGEVREMGLMLLYFIPCFYTDVSDIYLMEKKSRRVAVIAAGPLVELTLWGLFTIGYFYLPGGTLISNIIYIAMLTSGVKNIFVNFNPMIRVDGYYLLEEILGTEDLMERSRRRVAAGVRNLLGGKGPAGKDDSLETAGGRVFLIYGLIAFVYALLLILCTGAVSAHFLYPYVGSWAYIAFAVVTLLVLFLFVRRYRV